MALSTRATASSSSPAAAAGPSNDGVEISTPYSVGHNDLLIVGAGVLGRIVAEKWKQDSPVVPIGRSPRTDIILKAENAVLDSDGCVLRLAGLYKPGRGAHSYWLEKGIIDARRDHIVNLIHYEDAASLSIAIMKWFRSRIFIGCDNHPLSRQEIMDHVKCEQKWEIRQGIPEVHRQAFTPAFKSLSSAIICLQLSDMKVMQHGYRWSPGKEVE